MTLPDALVIGPQKAGTTWIHRYLESRGDVCLPHGVKETMFFDRCFDKGEAWYDRHFHLNSQQRLTVEVAPTYFHHPRVPERVRDTLGDISLLCTLRDPAERSFSLYLHMRRYGMTACKDFRSAVERHPEIIETSRYATHLERWFDVFGHERILVLFQEDLAERPADYTANLCRHLQIPFQEAGEALEERINAAALPASPGLAAAGQRIADGLRAAGLYPLINMAKSIGLKSVFFGRSEGELPRLSESERRWLVGILLPEIDRLEAMLDKDLSSWREA